MVSDLVWGEDNAGSNPVTPTILNTCPWRVVLRYSHGRVNRFWLFGRFSLRRARGQDIRQVMDFTNVLPVWSQFILVKTRHPPEQGGQGFESLYGGTQSVYGRVAECNRVLLYTQHDLKRNGIFLQRLGDRTVNPSTLVRVQQIPPVLKSVQYNGSVTMFLECWCEPNGKAADL